MNVQNVKRGMRQKHGGIGLTITQEGRAMKRSIDFDILETGQGCVNTYYTETDVCVFVA